MQFPLPTEDVFLDLSERAKLRLTGADHLRFLNGQVSNDMRQATVERAVYTGVMTIKGKLCADAFVHAVDDALLIDAPASVRETLAARLERYIVADDVQIEDVSESLGLCHLLNFSTPEDPMELRPTLFDPSNGLRLVRADRFRHDGLDVFFDPAREQEVHALLSAAGFTLLNEDALESLRILRGVPAWGAELDENTLPAEAGIEDRAVSFSKGCYIGQEVVSRIKSVGHVNRQLCGLRALDASPLYAGMRLFPAAADRSGREVGRITSAGPSAGHGGAAYVALGYVRRGSRPARCRARRPRAGGCLRRRFFSPLPGGSLYPALLLDMNPFLNFRARRLCSLLWAVLGLSLPAVHQAAASVAVIHFQTGGVQGRSGGNDHAFRSGCARDGREFQKARQQEVLQRHERPPGHPRDAGADG